MGDSPLKTFIIVALIGFLVFSYFEPAKGGTTLKSVGDSIKGFVTGILHKEPATTPDLGDNVTITINQSDEG